MIGGVGQKIQTVVELAEELYERVNELRARVESMSETVEDTADRVETMETELAEQRALISAIAEEQGVDVEAVRSSVASEVPGAGTDESSGATVASEATGVSETTEASDEPEE